MRNKKHQRSRRKGEGQKGRNELVLGPLVTIFSPSFSYFSFVSRFRLSVSDKKHGSGPWSCAFPSLRRPSRRRRLLPLCPLSHAHPAIVFLPPALPPPRLSRRQGIGVRLSTTLRAWARECHASPRRRRPLRCGLQPQSNWRHAHGRRPSTECPVRAGIQRTLQTLPLLHVRGGARYCGRPDALRRATIGRCPPLCRPWIFDRPAAAPRCLFHTRRVGDRCGAEPKPPRRGLPSKAGSPKTS